MERTYIKNLQGKIGQEVSISGWVDVRRDQGKMIFIDLRDVTGKVQMVALPNHEEALAVANQVRPEWVIQVTGKVNERPPKNIKEGAQNGNLEIEILNIEILGKAKELPFDKDTELNLDTYLDNLPLTLRTDRSRAIFKVQSEIIKAYRAFLNQEGFTEFQAPKLIGDDAEGSGEVFEVKYLYDKTAHLATSPQLYKQIMVGIFERVFTTGNVFRAEKHSTSRHLNEYTSIDIEMGFIKDHTDIMSMENKLMKHITNHLQTTCQAEFTLLGAEIPNVPDKIPSLKLREAQALILKETGKDKTNEPDLEPEDERWLCEWSKKEHDSDFCFVTHYPVSKRPFYTFEDDQDIGFTKSFDLLFRGVEITTGGQRRHDYDNLIEGAKMKGLNPDNFSFYLQAFKYGIPPHGGWGMGLERLTAKFLNIANVKEATLFPRDINRIDTLLSK
ncbi:MAG: aspartate--tRNA(Asn) ligase [Candidatus Vogelbacteria bacterium]|nr:aspartate--tRNA(Asn) ligase [Candidatus Vogelbacteria bacterium]